MKREIEVKIKIENIDEIREKILSIGAKFIGKEKQVDEYFDFEDDKLRREDKAIRIRNKKILAYKTNSLKEDGMKKVDETEFELQDYEGFITLLHGMGLKKSFLKEKERESFEIEKTKIEIDILPFGKFVEIEGNEENINKISEQLGFDKNQFIPNSYKTLYEKYCEEKNIENKKEIKFENENNN